MPKLPKKMPAMPKRFIFRWRWGRKKGSKIHKEVFDPSRTWAVHLPQYEQVLLHPTLRRPEAHNLFWQTLGHEMIHQLYRHSGTPAQERRAARLETRAGMILHDCFLHLVRFGIRCNPRFCASYKRK